MDKIEVPTPLRLRIEALAEPAARRVAFTVKGDSLNPERIGLTLRNDIANIFGPIDYRLAWFRRDDGGITFLVSGDRPATILIDNFLRRGRGRGLFGSATLNNDGYRSESFVRAANNLLKSYAQPSRLHGFGGSHL